MNQCTSDYTYNGGMGCFSYAVSMDPDKKLCDVCYWRNKYEQATALMQRVLDGVAGSEGWDEQRDLVSVDTQLVDDIRKATCTTIK